MALAHFSPCALAPNQSKSSATDSKTQNARFDDFLSAQKVGPLLLIDSSRTCTFAGTHPGARRAVHKESVFDFKRVSAARECAEGRSDFAEVMLLELASRRPISRCAATFLRFHLGNALALAAEQVQDFLCNVCSAALRFSSSLANSFRRLRLLGGK